MRARNLGSFLLQRGAEASETAYSSSASDKFYAPDEDVSIQELRLLSCFDLIRVAKVRNTEALRFDSIDMTVPLVYS